MKLAIAFWEQRAPKSYFYLLTPDRVVSRTGGWFGIFIHTPAPQDTTRLAYLSHNLKMLQNPMLYFVQSFVFFETGLGDGNIKDVVAGLEACDWSAIGVASLAWVPEIAPVAALPMVPLVDRRTKRFAVLLDAPETRPLVLLEDGAQPGSLRLAAEGQARIEVDASAADDGLVLSCDAGFGLLRGTPKGKPAPPLFRVPPGTSVRIDARGAAAGCLRAAGALATPVSDLVVGFRYELGARGLLATPALNAPDGPDGHPATLCLSPNAVLDPARSGFALDPAGAGFGSAFRTRGGGTIALAPDPGAAVSLSSTAVTGPCATSRATARSSLRHPRGRATARSCAGCGASNTSRWHRARHRPSSPPRPMRRCRGSAPRRIPRWSAPSSCTTSNPRAAPRSPRRRRDRPPRWPGPPPAR